MHILALALLLLLSLNLSAQDPKSASQTKKEKREQKELDDTPHPLVQKIELAMQQNLLIEPAGTCALDLYNILKVNVPKEKALPSLRDRLFDSLVSAGSALLTEYSQGTLRAYTRKDWAQSRAYIEKARELKPDHKEIRAIDSFYQGMLALADHDPVKAEKAFREGLKIEQKAAYLYNGLGRALSEQKKDSDSLKAYKKAIELSPQWSFPIVNAAIKFHKMGDYDSARKLAGEALNINAVDVEAHALLAQIDAAEGRLENAILGYRQFVVPQRPNSPADRLFLGRLLMEKGELRSAEQELEMALKLNSSDPKIRMYLSIVKARIARSEFDVALADLRQALADTPGDYQTQLAIATAMLDSHNIPVAIDELRRLLEIEPWQMTIRYKLAQLLLEADRPLEAVDEYKVLLKKNDKSRDLYFEIAMAYRKAEKSREAIEAFRKTLQLDNTFLPARMNLAQLLKETGEIAAAIAECKQILTLDPNYQPAVGLLKEMESVQPPEQSQTP